jgi:hypothetical protein
MKTNGQLQWSLFLPASTDIFKTGCFLSDENGWKSFRVEYSKQGACFQFFDAADFGHHYSRIDCPKLRDIVRSDAQDAFYCDRTDAWWNHTEECWITVKAFAEVQSKNLSSKEKKSMNHDHCPSCGCGIFIEQGAKLIDKICQRCLLSTPK